LLEIIYLFHDVEYYCRAIYSLVLSAMHENVLLIEIIYLIYD